MVGKKAPGRGSGARAENAAPAKDIIAPHQDGADIARLMRALESELTALEAMMGDAEGDDPEKRAKAAVAFGRAIEKLMDLKARLAAPDKDDEPDRDALIAEIERKLDRLSAASGADTVSSSARSRRA